MKNILLTYIGSLFFTFLMVVGPMIELKMRGGSIEQFILMLIGIPVICTAIVTGTLFIGEKIWNKK